VRKLSTNLTLGVAMTISAIAPQVAEATVGSVTVNASRPYEAHADYTYAEISMSGTVARSDGSVGNYTVPLVVIYPTSSHSNGVGVVDWVNSAFYHFFGFPAFEFGTFQFTLLTTDSYLFDKGYTYASVQWNKAVTEIFGPTAPNDGQPHNHLAYGSIERSADAWEIFLDAARLLKNPAAFVGPTAVGKVVSSGYSQGGALQLEMLVEGLDPTKVYDGHLASMIGLSCWKREDVAPHYGFLTGCNGVPSGDHAKTILLVSESDMIAFGGYHSRNVGDPNWRQYEMASVSHLPKSVLEVAPEQNPADPNPVFRGAVRNLDRWIRHGEAPPASTFLDGTVDGGGNFVPVADADGNWTGGLRLPHATVPLGTHAGLNAAGLDPFNVFYWLGGTFARFSDADLQARYPTRAAYVKRVKDTANALHDQRFILRDDRKAYIDAAETEALPFASSKPQVGTFDDEEEDVGGGCSVGSKGGPGFLLVLLGALLLRRKR
jgi:MYXO-CTERM domain-containing protein